MKISFNKALGARLRVRGLFFPRPAPRAPRLEFGFTMVEIAISLAVVGIALVAIIGVLPRGMRVQQANREETIINQDATVLMEAVRGGSQQLDDLTNYVFAISNYWTFYQTGNTTNVGANGYTFAGSFIKNSPTPSYPITNGFRIIGLLSTPVFTDNSGVPINNLSLLNGGNYYSNHIIAYVRSLSGPAVEKPPQDNPLITGDSFSYKVVCENLPVAVDTNNVNLQQPYTRQLTANLHEVRLTFLWPLQPNGRTGNGHQTFRTMVAGQLVQTNDASVTPNQPLYFFQSQSYTNAP